MPRFGAKSKRQLATCHVDLRTILNEAIKHVDFSVVEGVRSPERQQQLFAEGRTTLDGVTKFSRHQPNIDGLSEAVDVAPYPIDYSDREKSKQRFVFLAGYLKAVADRLLDEGDISFTLRQGVDWDGDGNFADQKFDDLPHNELISRG